MSIRALRYRYKGADLAALKPSNAWVRALWLLLPCSAMARDAVLRQGIGHVVGAELGAREHQHLAPVVLLDDVQQHLLLFGAAHGWMIWLMRCTVVLRGVT